MDEMAERYATGTGPGVITPDGCSVDFYDLLPAAHDVAEIVQRWVTAGGSVLELGAGAGRATRALVAAGFAVTAVDESAEMLARIDCAPTVLASIETLDLGARWDGVLLASHLVNTPAPRLRHAVLAACARHVRPGGCVLIERHPPSWFEAVSPGVSVRDGITYSLRAVRRDGPDLLTATIAYQVGDRTWTQTFTTRRVTDEDLRRLLDEHRLRLANYADGAGAWVRAVPDADR